jgi:hypothetical protein
MSLRYCTTLLFLLAAILVCSSALAQTLTPGGTWTVRDANNKVVGPYMGGSSVFVIVNGYAVELQVTHSALSSIDTLYFPQENCQGNPFIAISGASFLAGEVGTPAGQGPDGVIRIAPWTQQPVPISAKSMGRFGSCANVTLGIPAALPTQAGPNISQQFTAPFSVVEGASAPMLSPIVILALIVAIVVLAIVQLRVG